MQKKAKRKKGVTRHHISYNPEIVVELPSKGWHLMMTSAQSMNANEQNIKWLKNVRRALDYIIKEKVKECNQGVIIDAMDLL